MKQLYCAHHLGIYVTGSPSVKLQH